MAKLSSNKILERSRSLQMLKGFALAMMFLLAIPVFSQKIMEEQSIVSITDKLNEFDRLTEANKTREIYKQCLVSSEALSKPTIDVHGTEYQPLDSGKIFVQLIDENRISINNATCTLNVYYPNNTKFLTDAGMTKLGYYGLFYYDLVIPNTTGVYMTAIECRSPVIFQDFETTSFVSVSGNNILGDYTYTYHLDGLEHSYTAVSSNLTVLYNFSYPFGNTNNTRVVLDWYGTATAGSNLYFWFWNYSSNTWVQLPNALLGATSTLVYHISNTVTNGTQSLTNENPFRLRMSLSGVETIDTDLLMLSIYNITQTEIVLGSGEVHVGNILVNITGITLNISDQLNTLPSQVWNYTPNRNLTYYPNVTADVNYTYFDGKFNQTYNNQQTIYNFVQAMNTTMVTNQNYITSLVMNVSTQISDSWQEFWDTASARILS
jgi:hypothetical protein